MPDGVCPLLIPLVVSDASKWIAGLSEKGVKATGWWKGFNQKLSWDNFPEAKNLKHTLMVLPVHQYLKDEDIDYMIKSIQDVSVTL